VARRGLLAEFAALRERPVSDEELERAKAYAIGTNAIAQQSGASVLGDMLDAWLLGSGLSELDEYDAMVRGVTAEQMRKVAERCFEERRLVEGVVRGMGRSV
jgi:predicted Zn-dependent peptidase